MSTNQQAKNHSTAADKNKQTGLSLKLPSGAKAPKPNTSEIIDPAVYSKRLEKSTTAINKEVAKINGVIKSFCKIGYELYKVREEKLYLGSDHKNVSEYAETVFQFQNLRPLTTYPYASGSASRKTAMLLC